MDELLKLFSNLNAQGDSSWATILPTIMKLMAQNEQKKDVELSTSELSSVLHELIKKDL